MKGKKGVVGETVTWVAAFLIIFFIMFVFLVFSRLVATNPISMEISKTEDRLEFNKNYFYKEILINPEKIKFVKKIQDDKA